MTHQLNNEAKPEYCEVCRELYPFNLDQCPGKPVVTVDHLRLVTHIGWVYRQLGYLCESPDDVSLLKWRRDQLAKHVKELNSLCNIPITSGVAGETPGPDVSGQPRDT